MELAFLVARGNTCYKLYIVLISFFFKVSLPGFHFLKVEVYKYLDIINVVSFSIVTIYVNYLFMSFFFNQQLVFYLISDIKLMSLLMLVSLSSFIYKLKLNNLCEFFAFSGFSVGNLILLNFLV